jgi:hypothetical protein
VTEPQAPEGDGAAVDDCHSPYSRAFENIVQGPEDIVGLLAYALYKEAIREEARQGGAVDGSTRNPPPATVTAFRMAAEQRLTEVVKRGIEEAIPDIQQNAFTSAIAGLESEVKSHIDQRTSFATALFTNIIAWLTTLAIAAIIIFLLNRPSPEQSVAHAMQGLESHQPPTGKAKQ